MAIFNLPLRFLLIICVFNIIILVLGEDNLSAKECDNLGFTGLALCSDCKTFAEYVKNEELVSDCLKCCTDDSDDSMSKVTFTGAILEVCMRKLVFYPEIVAFIEEEKDEFPALKVQYAYASPPKLIMLDKDGQHKESIRSHLDLIIPRRSVYEGKYFKARNVINHQLGDRDDIWGDGQSVNDNFWIKTWHFGIIPELTTGSVNSFGSS